MNEITPQDADPTIELPTGSDPADAPDTPAPEMAPPPPEPAPTPARVKVAASSESYAVYDVDHKRFVSGVLSKSDATDQRKALKAAGNSRKLEIRPV